jgi:hypothetical protein
MCILRATLSVLLTVVFVANIVTVLLLVFRAVSPVLLPIDDANFLVLLLGLKCEIKCGSIQMHSPQIATLESATCPIEIP